MSRLLKLSAFAFLILVALTATSFVTFKKQTLANLSGAWQLQDVPNEQVILFVNDYVTYTSYNKEGKEFEQSMGGTYKIDEGRLLASIEFNSANKELVGQTIPYPFSLENDVLSITVDGQPTTWRRMDDGTGPLAGLWRITGRMQEGKVIPVQQTGTRKTVKILTGKRFQWVAMDPATKEFSGTGGGTFSFAGGKYTETIEFFSRDNSRVGASLSFDGKLEPDGWHHTGLSSRGDTIYEIWNKVK